MISIALPIQVSPLSRCATGRENRTQADSGIGPEESVIPIPGIIHAITSEGSAYRDEEQREDRGKRFREWLTIGLLMFTLIAIGLQVNEMIKVYNPIREQAEAAQKAQRAWIGPSNADFSNPPIERQETKVLVSWSDSGKETAINLIHHTMIWMPQEEALNNGVVIGAMSRFEQECLATEPADTATQVAYPIGQYALSWRIVPTKDLIEGRVILIVGGCFVYRSFGKPHHSSFCYYFKGNETDPGHFSICPVGNNAD